MHIVFFTHPNFQTHQSMPRYARWLAKGMQQRGHTVDLWTAAPRFFNLPVPKSMKKWMGYLDQFFVFPRQVKRRMKQLDKQTLFVFTDHALGPWVPLAIQRRHIIHCHDFLAQQSALDRIPQNPTGWSGKKYQAYIRNGYQQGKNFISISYKTRNDLQQLLPSPPQLSEVVYNGVNSLFNVIDPAKASESLTRQLNIDLSKGFLLHVGGNQWYKNRAGVVLLYAAWRKRYSHSLPLLMIGEKPSDELEAIAQSSGYAKDIHFLSGMMDTDILHAYNIATVFLFPSLDEGFGWPIAEAMACGCPVITTGEAPMNEVGGEGAFYVPRMPVAQAEMENWLQVAATTVQHVVTLPEAERKAVQQKGLENVQRFDSEKQLNAIEAIYKRI